MLDGFLERAVRSQVRNRFGGRLKAFVSGGAALHEEVGLFFEALGGPLFCRATARPKPRPLSPSTVGKVANWTGWGLPMRGVEVQIANDGEIIVRGELLMNGYWKQCR